MTYVEGGAWNSVKNIGRALDVIIWIGGVVTGCIGIVGSVKEVLRRNARGLVVQSTNALLKKKLSISDWIFGINYCIRPFAIS